VRRSLLVSSVRLEVVQRPCCCWFIHRKPATARRPTSVERGPRVELWPASFCGLCAPADSNVTTAQLQLWPLPESPLLSPPVSRLDRVCCIRVCGISRAGAPGRCGLRALERGALVTRYQSASGIQYPSFHWPARSSGRTPPPALWGHCRLCLSSPLSDLVPAAGAPPRAPPLLPRTTPSYATATVRPAAGRQSSTTRPSSMSLRMPRCSASQSWRRAPAALTWRWIRCSL